MGDSTQYRYLQPLKGQQDTSVNNYSRERVFKDKTGNQTNTKQESNKLSISNPRLKLIKTTELNKTLIFF